MCKISIDLSTTTPSGTQLDSVVGQYRLVDATSWITFPITLSNPETPDINIFGNYELRVNVTNNIADTSAWSDIVTFSITSRCPGNCNSVQPYKKYRGFQELRYAQREYTSPNFNPNEVHCGTKIRIFVNLYHFKNGAYNVTYDQTYTATQDYPTVRDWYNAEVVNLGSFGDDWLRGYGFSTDGLQFWVHSRKDGTARSKNRTEVFFEMGLS